MFLGGGAKLVLGGQNPQKFFARRAVLSEHIGKCAPPLNQILYTPLVSMDPPKHEKGTFIIMYFLI